jgi:hypothetical protein
MTQPQNPGELKKIFRISVNSVSLWQTGEQ